MADSSNLSFGLGSLPLISSAVSRSISAENPTGESGGGAREMPDPGNPAFRLGTGWKARPCLTLAPSSTTELARIEGPATIRHIWMTADVRTYRECVLRFYWDEEESPSIEVPFGDFFANGHGLRYDVNSLPIAVNPDGGFNSYWPMPFAKSCRIAIENPGLNEIGGFFYQFDYELGEIPTDAAYLHAQWRRSVPHRYKPDHVLLDSVKGRGHYVGTFLAWTQLSDGWWGEGEIKFFIDGDTDHPTICGTGTEDYVGGAWGFGGRTYSTAFLGYPLFHQEPGGVPKHALYRWHVLDPIRFQSDLRVTIQALGWWPDKTFQPLADDIASTAFWYQAEPHATFPNLPPVDHRWPR
jgi:hypothetical protein